MKITSDAPHTQEKHLPDNLNGESETGTKSVLSDLIIPLQLLPPVILSLNNNFMFQSADAIKRQLLKLCRWGKGKALEWILFKFFKSSSIRYSILARGIRLCITSGETSPNFSTLIISSKSRQLLIRTCLRFGATISHVRCFNLE